MPLGSPPVVPMFPVRRAAQPAAGRSLCPAVLGPRSILLLVLALALPARAADEVSAVFARVTDSVVTVRTIGRQLSPQDAGLRTTEVDTGSGVLVSASGDVLTSAHVVQTSDAIVVEFSDGTRVGARVAASDAGSDIARLRLDTVPPGRLAIPLADSDSAKIGIGALVLGAPEATGHTLTLGHVTARRLQPAFTGGMRQVELLQTDAVLNPSDSGAPMFDLQGRLIGIVRRVAPPVGGVRGPGFAVTSNTVRELLIDGPATWTGIDWIFVEGELARALNLPPGASGLLVQNVARDSPGERLGLKGGTLLAKVEGEDMALGGDVILTVLGLSVTHQSLDAIRAAVISLPPEEKLTVTVFRAGQKLTLTAP